MPVVNNIGRCDIALLSSADGSLPSSQGASDFPLFDSHNYWDPDARQRKVIGQAVGVGGDRHNLQTAAGVDIRKYDQNGTAHHYIGSASNPSNLYHCLHGPQTDAVRPVTFNFSGSTHTNMGGTTFNNVWGIGSNDNGGVPVVPGKFVFRDAWEDNYEVEPGVWQCERHVGAVYDPVAGSEVRPITISVVTSTGFPYPAWVSFETHQLKQVLEGGSTVLMQSMQTGDDYNFITPAFSAYQNLPSLLNQTLFGTNGLDTSFKVNGRTSRSNYQINGVDKWSLYAHSDNNLYIQNGSGGNAIQFIQTDLTARFGGTIFGAIDGALPRILRLANGTATGGDGDYAFQVGGVGSVADGECRLVHVPTGAILQRWTKTGQAFFGAAPVAKAASPGTASGTDAAVINAIATIIRNLGFCS